MLENRVIELRKTKEATETRNRERRELEEKTNNITANYQWQNANKTLAYEYLSGQLHQNI